MAWDSAVGTLITIEEQFIKKYEWHTTGFVGDLVRWSAIQHIKTQEYDGVTEAVAVAYADTHKNDTNTIVKAVRSSAAGSYKVVISIDSMSSFVPP